MAASVTIGSTKANNIDLVMDTFDDEYERPHPCYEYVPRSADQVSDILTEVSPILIDETLYEQMEARARLGKFQTSIGSMNVTNNKYIVNDDTTESESSSDESSIEDDLLLDEMHEALLRGDIDLDDIMVNATHAGRSKGINAEQLAKTWRIDLETAK
jgi:hypothetical protein